MTGPKNPQDLQTVLAGLSAGEDGLRAMGVGQHTAAGEAPLIVDDLIFVEVAAPVVQPDRGQHEEIAPPRGCGLVQEIDLVRRRAVSEVCGATSRCRRMRRDPAEGPLEGRPTLVDRVRRSRQPRPLRRAPACDQKARCPHRSCSGRRDRGLIRGPGDRRLRTSPDHPADNLRAKPRSSLGARATTIPRGVGPTPRWRDGRPEPPPPGRPEPRPPPCALVKQAFPVSAPSHTGQRNDPDTPR